jgi:hypothetical protein
MILRMPVPLICASPDYDEEIEGKQWHFGLFLQQQWLQDQGQAVVTELQTIRRVFNE